MSTISASTTSTTAFKITTDTTGALVFQTGASPTTAMTLGSDQSVTFAGTPTYSGGTANGVAYLNGSKVLTTGTALVFDGTNLGVGVTPSAWSTGKAVEIGAAGNSLWGLTADVYLISNTYYNAGWKYASGNAAGVGIYEINGLTHYWYGASSGSTGASVTLGSKMVMDASTLSLVGLQGIKFQATQSPSSDANVLDDYEEGTWSPVLSDGTNTVSLGTGSYTKIGRFVRLACFAYNVDVTSLGASSHLRITGMPFGVGTLLYANAMMAQRDPVVTGINESIGSTILLLYNGQNNPVDYGLFSRNTWGGTGVMTSRWFLTYEV